MWSGTGHYGKKGKHKHTTSTLSAYMRPHYFTTHCIPLLCTTLTKPTGLTLSSITKKHPWEILLLTFKLWSCSLSPSGKKSVWVISSTSKRSNIQLISQRKLFIINRSFKDDSFSSPFSLKVFFKQNESCSIKKWELLNIFAFPHHWPFWSVSTGIAWVSAHLKFY